MGRGEEGKGEEGEERADSNGAVIHYPPQEETCGCVWGGGGRGGEGEGTNSKQQLSHVCTDTEHLSRTCRYPLLCSSAPL